MLQVFSCQATVEHSGGGEGGGVCVCGGGACLCSVLLHYGQWHRV